MDLEEKKAALVKINQQLPRQELLVDALGAILSCIDARDEPDERGFLQSQYNRERRIWMAMQRTRKYCEDAIADAVEAEIDPVVKQLMKHHGWNQVMADLVVKQVRSMDYHAASKEK